MARLSTADFNLWKQGLSDKEIKKRRNLEAKLVAQIIYYLKLQHFVVGKTKTIGIYREKDGETFYSRDKNLMLGKPDIECFAHGIMYCIEVKSPDGAQTDNQKEYQKYFHKPPDRIYILAHKLEDVTKVIR